MILFQLKCTNTHEFEAWFRDSAAFKSQSTGSKIECPVCGDTGVTKALMTPHIAKGGRKSGPAERRATEIAEQILDAVDQVRRNVEENCDYVGDEFADEARRIHYGETEEHAIYGEATDAEATELDDEGIEFHRIPGPPRRDN